MRRCGFVDRNLLVRLQELIRREGQGRMALRRYHWLAALEDAAKVIVDFLCFLGFAEDMTLSVINLDLLVGLFRGQPANHFIHHVYIVLRLILLNLMQHAFKPGSSSMARGLVGRFLQLGELQVVLPKHEHAFEVSPAILSHA